MDVKQFRADLINRAETRGALEGLFTREAFMHELSERFSEAEEIENLQVLDFEGPGLKQRKLSVQGFDLDDSDNSVALAVLLFDGGPAPKSITQTEVNNAFKALRTFLEEAVARQFQPEREEATFEYQLAEDLRMRGRNVSRYRLYLVSDREVGTSVKSVPSTSLNEVPVDHYVWDIQRFKKVAESQSGRESLVIDLRKWHAEGLPALEVVDSANGLRTYLAAVPGDMLADLYGAHGSRLLEGNVRSYLSNRGKVNKGIRVTVASAPANFLAYNNGITATATAVEHVGGSLASITDLQIVNGGQTTASLFYVKRENKEKQLHDVYVQMKLVVVEPAVAAEMIPLISRYANSQNKVSEADFFSNSPFHVRLAELSQRVMVPARPGALFQTKWYYERTRGSYQNEKAKRSLSEQKKFEAEFPRSQVIDKTAAAKYEVTWGLQPHRVSAGAQKNFMAFAELVAAKWEQSSDAFNELYWKQLVAKGLIFEQTRKAIAKADWYEKGYLANLTTYAVAKFAYEIGKQARGGVFDLESVWEKQEVPEVVLREMVAIAQKVQMVLTADNRPVQNVTEWAKKPECWDLVKHAPHALSAEVVASVAAKEKVASRKKEAARTQKVDNGIDVQMAVVSKQASEWLALEEFSREGKLLTPKYASLLDMVTGRKAGFPTEAQCKALMQLLNTAKDHGYVEF